MWFLWWSCQKQQVKICSSNAFWSSLFSYHQQNLRHWPSPPRLHQQKMVPLGDHWTWRTTKRGGGLFEHARSAASDPACSMTMSTFSSSLFSSPFWVGAAMELGRDSLKLPVICNINHSTIYCIDLLLALSSCTPHKCGSVLFGVFLFLLVWVLFLFCWCSSLVHSVFSISLRSGFP